MTTKTGDQKRIIGLVYLVATAFFIGLFSTSVFAADPGHGAGVIGSADFETSKHLNTIKIQISTNKIL